MRSDDFELLVVETEWVFSKAEATRLESHRLWDQAWREWSEIQSVVKQSGADWQQRHAIKLNAGGE